MGTDIATDLECLPIFLAGCNNLLVLTGKTYTSRLWCILELFVYVCMQHEDAGMRMPTLRVFGHDERERAEVQILWGTFSAEFCECSIQSDYDRIMAVMQTATPD